MELTTERKKAGILEFDVIRKRAGLLEWME